MRNTTTEYNSASSDAALSDAIFKSSLESARITGSLERGMESLKESVRNQQNSVGAIKMRLEEGVAELGGFSTRAAELSSSIAETARQAKGKKRDVEQLTRDIAVMSAQATESASFLRELSSLIEEVVRDSQAIKNATENIGVIAINTSIEAARAGDHGRGFSVIAREIRRLSEESGRLSEGILRKVSKAEQGLRALGTSVESARASASSAADASRRFSGDFERIASNAEIAEKSVSEFSAIARERVEAEQAISSDVRAIADECSLIVGQGDTAAGLATALRKSTLDTFNSLDARGSAHRRAAIDRTIEFAKRISPRELQNREILDRTLSAAFAESKAFELIYAMDEEGTQISSNLGNPAKASRISGEGYGVKRSGKEYFAIPRSTGEPYVSPAYFSSATNTLCITVAVPVKSVEGEFLGVLAIDVDAGKTEELG